MVDVVIVGAGPIGLAHAWAIKKLNPSLRIVIHEKYEVYKRHHSLVMRPQHLQALMKATNTLEHPILKDFLHRLKEDPHIRTNELERVFKSLVQETEEGAEPTVIKIGKITEENFQEQIIQAYPEAKFIIGADGTHSIVSKVFFGNDNQVKHDQGYLLQLRYDIHGEEKPDRVAKTAFYQEMARLGLIANEVVGRFENGITPVNLQIVISKEAFERLHPHATSGNPILLTEFEKLDVLPSEFRTFVGRYLDEKIKQCKEDGQSIDYSTATISVNETPATYAKDEHKFYTRADGTKVAIKLVGDAQLGLSFFKGLNAGIEAAAEFFALMHDAFVEGLNNADHIESGLDSYKGWFQKFAAKKINEGRQFYNRYIIVPKKIMETLSYAKGSSMTETLTPLEALQRDFLELQKAPANQVRNDEGRQFPHRSYDPVMLGQFAYISPRHHLKKTFKLLADFVKPYKSTAQFKQDFKQPLVGLVNVLTGIAKIITGIVSPKRFVDGLFSLIRGVIEIATFPLAWLVKPLTRGLATGMYQLIWGPKKIEDNAGMQRLRKSGLKKLEAFEKKLENLEEKHGPSAQSIYDVRAYIHDMHRKFEKGSQREQKTHVKASVEASLYNEISKEYIVEPDLVRQYFTLFSHKPGRQEDDEAPAVVVRPA